MIKTLAIVCGGLILLLIVVALIVYLTLSNPGLLDFGLRDGVLRLAGVLTRLRTDDPDGDRFAHTLQCHHATLGREIDGGVAEGRLGAHDLTGGRL